LCGDLSFTRTGLPRLAKPSNFLAKNFGVRLAVPFTAFVDNEVDLTEATVRVVVAPRDPSLRCKPPFPLRFALAPFCFGGVFIPGSSALLLSKIGTGLPALPPFPRLFAGLAGSVFVNDDGCESGCGDTMAAGDVHASWAFSSPADLS
jgi:hypothetical protein